MTLENVISISSLLIALAALIFSIVSFKRQQSRAEVHAKMSVKPWLSIKSQRYEDLKSIQLVNHGIGPAIIKKAEFWRNNGQKPINNIVDLFDLKICWNTFVNVVQNHAIPAGERIILVQISLDHLRSQSYTQEQAVQLLRDWQNQKTGINVRVEYEDIYGNLLPILEETLV